MMTPPLCEPRLPPTGSSCTLSTAVLTLYCPHEPPYWTTATGHAHQPHAALYASKAQGRSLVYVRYR